MLIVTIIKNNTMTNMQQLHLFLFSLTIFTSLTVSVHFSTSLSAIFFYTYNFYNPNTHQHHMIYPIQTHNYQDSNYILYHTHTFTNQLFTFPLTFIIILTLFIIKNTCLQSTFTLVRFMPFYVSSFISSRHQIEYFNI